MVKQYSMPDQWRKITAIRKQAQHLWLNKGVMLKGNKPNKEWKQQLYVEFGVSTEVPCTSDRGFQDTARKFVAALKQREPHQFPNAAIAASQAGIAGQMQQSAPSLGAVLPAQSTFAGTSFAGPPFAGPYFGGPYFAGPAQAGSFITGPSLTGPSPAGSSFTGPFFQSQSTGLTPPIIPGSANPIMDASTADDFDFDDVGSWQTFNVGSAGFFNVPLPPAPVIPGLPVDPNLQAYTTAGDGAVVSQASTNLVEENDTTIEDRVRGLGALMDAGDILQPPSSESRPATATPTALTSASSSSAQAPTTQDQESVLSQPTGEPVGDSHLESASEQTTLWPPDGDFGFHLSSPLTDGEFNNLVDAGYSEPQVDTTTALGTEPNVPLDGSFESSEQIDKPTLQGDVEKWQIYPYEPVEPVSHTLSAE